MPQPDTSTYKLPAPPPSMVLLTEVGGMKAVRTRRPIRAASGIALLSLACVMSLLVLVLGLRKDLGSVPTLPLLLYGAACLTSFGGQLAAALVPPPGQVLPSGHRSSRMSMVSLAITVPVGVVLGIRAHTAGPVNLGHLTNFWAHAIPCLLNGLAVAAVPALLGVRALRRLVPRGSWRMALAVGGACGVLAGLALELHCPRYDLVHVALAHGSVMVLPALLLALLGIRLLTD
jgi:hypothetical protein